MRKQVGIIAVVALVALLGVSGPAQSAFIFFTDSFPMSTTNWDGMLTFPKFDPSLGTLTSIDFFLEGNVLGNVQFESLDAAPTTVHTALQAEITLHRPDLSTIVVTTPVAEHYDDVTAFDGVIDFGGTSGRSYLDIQASGSASATSPPPVSDLTLFTGPGTIDLPVSARGQSMASGAGNLLTLFNTAAAANARVTYWYDTQNPVPEASTLTLFLLGGGLVALGSGVRKLRK